MKKHILLVLLTVFAIQVMGLDATRKLPEDLGFVEMEDFTPSGPGWYVRDHFKGYPGTPSGNKFLSGYRKGDDTATGTIEIPKAGKYYLWIRYIDLFRHRKNMGFKLKISADGKQIAEKEFDLKSVRTGPDKKWGRKWNNFARLVWVDWPVELPAGKLTVTVAKSSPLPKNGHALLLDCLAFTQDSKYQPEVSDFQKPIYVKIKMLNPGKRPVGIHIRGRCPHAIFGSTGPYNLTKSGLHKGTNTGLDDKNISTLLKAGDETPWVNISPLLTMTGDNKIRFYAMEHFRRPLPRAVDFTIYFSADKSMKGLYKQFTRRGPGAGINCMINLKEPDKISDDASNSRKSLEYAQAVPEMPGKQPKIYPFITFMSLDPLIEQRETVDNELRVMRMLGINSLDCSPSLAAMPEFGKLEFIKFVDHHYTFGRTKPKGCLAAPDKQRLSVALKKYCGELIKEKVVEKNLFIKVQDEPGFRLVDMPKWKACREGFKVYLKKLKLTPEQLDIKSWKDVKLELDKTGNPYLYYYTLRYRNQIMADFFKLVTEYVKDCDRNLSTMANFATALTFNMIRRGDDWFLIFGSGALTYGWTEDWLNQTFCYQLCGYQMDVMRTACSIRNYPYGIYDILSYPRTRWDIVCKGFTEIGHGAQAIDFYYYGPHYTSGSGASSQHPYIYKAIKELCYATGAVEKYIVPGKNPRGDAAMLLSVTSDIWNWNIEPRHYGNIFGTERAFLYLLLRHLGCRLDILSEEMITGGKLNDYKMLFITGSHLDKSLVQPLTAWVKAGGVLYLGAGAAQFDQFNQPLGLDSALGVKRGKFTAKEFPGRPAYELSSREMIHTVNFGKYKIPAICGFESLPESGKIIAKTAKGLPAAAMFECGSGKVISCGFFPALGYMQEAVKIKKQAPKTPESLYSCTEYPAGPRSFMSRILELSNCHPALTTNDYLVEANLIRDKETAIIVLSNWSGKPRNVEIKLRGFPKFKKCTSVINPVKITKNSDGEMICTMTLSGPGDYLVCE